MKISIIITNFNYGKYITRCLRSCVSQNFIKKDYEIIIVDDLSSDKSKKIIKNFLINKNIHLIENKKNIGVAASSNKGIKKAKGKYIVRVDADDFISKEFLNILYFSIEGNKNYLGSSCNYQMINNDGKKLNVLDHSIDPISCGIMYNKKKLVKFGMYNSKFRHREEEELRFRLGKNYKIVHTNINLYRYRMHNTNKTKMLDFKNLYKKKIKEFVNRDYLLKNYNKIIVIIPARKNSKRLKNKNIFNFLGKPMIYWSIKACKESNYIKDVFVSSDSSKILNISKNYGAQTIKRSDELSDDKTIKMDVITSAVKHIEKKFYKPDIVVSLQANSPEVKSAHLDNAILHLLKYKKQEVISVDKNFNQDSAIRVMKYKTVFQKSLSTNVGFVITNLKDIHTRKDIKKIKNAN